MLKEGKFGLYEAVAMASLLTFTKIFYTTPSVAIRRFGTSAWYGTLFSAVVSMGFFLLVYTLMKRFPGKNLVDIFQIVMGKVIGKFLSLVFCTYFLYYAASNLREFLEIVKTYSFPYTAPSIILGAFILSSVILAFLGLEIIARLSYVFIVPVIIALIILLSLASSYYDADYLFPLLGHNITTTLYYGFIRSSAYDEVIILAFIIQSIYGVKQFKKAGLLSIGIAGIVIGVCLLLIIMAFEYFGAVENLSDLFQISRIIYLSRFLQRVESLFLFIWVIVSLLAVTISFYISISTYCKTFNIDNHKPLVFPFAYFLFMVAILPKNLPEVIEINMRVLREYSLFFVYGVPVLVLLISLIMRKKGDAIRGKKA